MDLPAPLLPLIPVAQSLERLGFARDPGPLEAWKLDTGNLEIIASLEHDIVGRGHWMARGWWRTTRACGELNLPLPEACESDLQLAAILAYALPADFVPVKTVPWLADGRLHRELVRSVRESLAYAARPVLYIPREKLRPVRLALRAAAEQADPEDMCELRFDGECLKLSFGDQFHVVPATAPRDWPPRLRVPLAPFWRLPRRWVQDPIWLDLWQGRFHFGSLVVDLPPGNGSAESPS